MFISLCGTVVRLGTRQTGRSPDINRRCFAAMILRGNSTMPFTATAKDENGLSATPAVKWITCHWQTGMCIYRLCIRAEHQTGQFACSRKTTELAARSCAVQEAQSRWTCLEDPAQPLLRPQHRCRFGASSWSLAVATGLLPMGSPLQEIALSDWPRLLRTYDSG